MNKSIFSSKSSLPKHSLNLSSKPDFPQDSELVVSQENHMLKEIATEEGLRINISWCH
jgi:hypothetical protein